MRVLLDDLVVLPFGVVLIVARSNRVQDLQSLIPEILAALDRVQPGRLQQVGA